MLFPLLQPGILYTKTILKALVGTSSIIKEDGITPSSLHLRQGLEASEAKGSRTESLNPHHDDDCERAPNCTMGMEDLDLVTEACTVLCEVI